MEQKDRSRVVLLPCGSYDEEKIYQCLCQGLDLLGGIESFVKKDEKILIKPNLLKKAEVDKAVITHPAVVGAFARILKEAGCADVSMADSPAASSTSTVIRGTGMDTAMQKYGVRVLDYTESVEVEYPQGHQAKSFILPRELMEADAVFSICKMKTHALERLTGAVKNSYGFVYGRNKALGHTHYPSADSFARMLVDLTTLIHPRLYLMDGIVAMEGNGPGSGDPIHMDVLLLSMDPVALDTIFAYLVYVKPERIPTIYHGNMLGLGTSDMKKIQLLTPDGEICISEAVEKYGNPDFRIVRGAENKNFLDRITTVFRVLQKKPYIIRDNCVHCGICVESCPVDGKAIHFSRGKDQPPVYDYHKCIRCFCCQEMCPRRAIGVK